jgi:hypothetical protein
VKKDRKAGGTMRKRMTYANVAATLALVFSMSGGALAAKHYLIESTKQISPKVLKKLHGATGHRGTTGPAGSAGATGATGKDGAPGKEGPRGPSAGFQAFADQSVVISTSLTHMGQLAVPAGSYLVTAKLVVTDGSTTASDVRCLLTNDETQDSDSSNATVGSFGSAPGSETITLQSTATLSAPAIWQVRCGATPEVGGEELKIQAIQIASSSNKPA